MQYQRRFPAWLVCSLLTTMLFVTVAATSSGGHEFSGYFDISGVHEQGELMQVTLHLRLFNHSDADASSVIVTLIDSSPAMTFRGNFQPVKVWKSHQFIELSQEFSVTKREFQEWMKPPAQPNLVILFRDAKGMSWQRGAQISRRPFVRLPAQD